MATHTVRLEPDVEQALRDVQSASGLTVSAALKKGLLVLRDRLKQESASSPFEVYRTLDLGKGGYSRVPARRAKAGLREIIRRKHGR